MQGQDLHPARVRFQPQQLGLVIAVGQGDGLFQPVQQAGQAQHLARGFLQQFAQLQVVGHAPLAIVDGQQALRPFGTQVGNQRIGAAALQAFAPQLQPVLVLTLEIAIDLQRGNVAGTGAEQHRGQQRAQAALVGRLQQGQQQQPQLAGLFAGKQALLAGGHRRHPALLQGLLDQRGLAVAAYQHGDVTGLDRLLLDQGLALPPLPEHGRDRIGAQLGGQLARLVRTERFVAIPLHPLQHQPGGRHCIDGEIRIGIGATGMHGLEADALLAETALAGLGVQRIDGRQHTGPRAEVVVQHQRHIGLGLGLQIGVHVTATETVDGLLGITDQEQRRRFSRCLYVFAVAEDAAEDRPLARIGVLELIDQGNGVLLAQLRHQRIPTRAFQRARHAFDQVVIGLQATLRLEVLHTLPGLLAQAVQQVDGLRTQHVVQRLPGLHPVRQRGLQGRCRGLAGAGLGGAPEQRFRQQVGGLLVQRALAIPVAELLEQLMDPAGLVAVAIEPLVLHRRQQGLAEILAMAGNGLPQLRAGVVQALLRLGQGDFLRPGLQRLREQRLLAEQGRQVGGQLCVVLPQRGQHRDLVGILGQHPPQVSGHLGMQRLEVGDQLRAIQAVATVQRVLAQHPGTETMDGEHCSQVGFFGGQAQALFQCRCRLAAAGQVIGQDGAGQGDFRRCIRLLAVLHLGGGQRQTRADALAQLLGGRIGEGHRQHLANAQVAFHHQPGEQRGQGIGLAGTGTGLDQLHAIQRYGQRIAVARLRLHVAVFHQAFSSSSRLGTSPRVSSDITLSAVCSNAFQRCPSASGSRPR